MLNTPENPETLNLKKGGRAMFKNGGLASIL
jgi:hypothetical protein